MQGKKVKMSAEAVKMSSGKAPVTARFGCEGVAPFPAEMYQIDAIVHLGYKIL